MAGAAKHEELELQNMKNMKVINPLMLNGQSHKSYKE